MRFLLLALVLVACADDQRCVIDGRYILVPETGCFGMVRIPLDIVDGDTTYPLEADCDPALGCEEYLLEPTRIRGCTVEFSLRTEFTRSNIAGTFQVDPDTMTGTGTLLISLDPPECTSTDVVSVEYQPPPS